MIYYKFTKDEDNWGIVYKIHDVKTKKTIATTYSREMAAYITKLLNDDKANNEPKCMCPADSIYLGCPIHGNRAGYEINS